MTTSQPSLPIALPLRVLLVVDDLETVRVVQRTLLTTHDELLIAADLADGLAKTNLFAPELVFVDIAMGNAAGLAVVHHLRALDPSVEVFALTPPQLPPPWTPSRRTWSTGSPGHAPERR